MVDIDLLFKKLAFIDSCVADLRHQAHLERLAHDIREERFVEHSLQLAIQAALDVAAHIISDQRLGEPETNRHLFQLLSNNDWITAELSETLQNMAGFRNILVHGYAAVDVAILRDIVEHHLDDLTRFSATIRQQL